MYLVKTPRLIQKLFPNLIWRIPSADRIIYFTFDDGPVPEVTPWVLEQLKKFQAKATFFCVGENVEKFPELCADVLAAGHEVGNHTYHHLNGWKTETSKYLENVDRCNGVVKTDIFRPPYGKLTPRQMRQIRCKYRVVMWDVLSGDFDPDTGPELCLKNVVNNAGTGSIIVFHDNLKAWEKLKVVLPKALSHFSERGYRFESLSKDSLEKALKVIGTGATSQNLF